VKPRSTIRKRRPEAGIALLISIFVLLLISVVAIALIVSSGTESALAGNYRSSTGVYYAALAGLEEARGRLSTKDPNSFKNTAPGFLPSPGTTLAVGSPVYVINPVGGETVAPWDPSSTYFDTEFGIEFSSSGFAAPPNPSPNTLSVWKRSPLNTLPFPGPLYKWVRINAVSEKSLLNRDTFPYDTKIDATPLYYDGVHLTDNSSAGAQVLEITALAVLPNGSQKLLQYLTAPIPINFPNLPAALTLTGSTGNGAAYSAPSSNAGFSVKGIDQDSNGSCSPGSAVPAIGVFTDVDKPAVITGGNGGTGILPAASQPNYTGTGIAPDVENISAAFPANLQKPSQLDNLAQTIIQNADLIITPTPVSPALLGTATQSSIPTTTTPSNPLTIVVNGNLDLTAWNHTGYGLLLVTGKLTYDPDVFWNGIILVIGQGTLGGINGGGGEIHGGVFVAKTRDPNLNLLPDPNLGAASAIFTTNMGGNGIRYSSCWIKNSLPAGSYKILSFHEISQ
jgi:hypothetical protein